MTSSHTTKSESFDDKHVEAGREVRSSAGDQKTYSQEDLEKLKQELKESLDAEAKVVDKQMELLMERRDIKIALEDAQVEEELSKLRSEKQRLVATREANK